MYPKSRGHAAFATVLLALAVVTACAPRPGNIIVMISDGCGYAHVEATDFHEAGRTGAQVYESFPVRLGVATFMVDGSYDPQAVWSDFDAVKTGATDSAAAATAMATGRKTSAGAIGMCENGRRMPNVVERAEELGKATGVVTSVQFSHATPAAFVAHNLLRVNVADIANEMIFHSAVDVIMGCGNPDYDNAGRKREEPGPFHFVGGEETWDALTAGATGADADGDGEKDAWTLVRSREEFRKLAEGQTPPRVIGVPAVFATLQQRREGDAAAEPFAVARTESVPTLAEMTRAALNTLDDNPDGLFLMVEGGAVDWASHANQSGRMIEEESDFNRSVEAVCEWIAAHGGWRENLLIVTADHETGCLTGPGSGPSLAEDGETDGPPVWREIENRGAGRRPGMEWHSHGHTNSLVPLYAKGAGARRLKKNVLGKDPKRGRYIDNTEIGKTVFDLWSEEE